VLRRYRDGSFLSRIGTVQVRVIECEITIATSAGQHTGVYRLATTLLDWRQYPAPELVTLYHQRWEIEAAGGTGPDRGSFTIALNAARDLLTQAASVIAGTVIDRIGDIGRRVLDNLLPDRRQRVSARIVKRAISKYQARGPRIDRRSYKATLSINILTAPGP
jgi:hypothetical protein